MSKFQCVFVYVCTHIHKYARTHVCTYVCVCIRTRYFILLNFSFGCFLFTTVQSERFFQQFYVSCHTRSRHGLRCYITPQHHHIINPLQLSGVAYTEQD